MSVCPPSLELLVLDGAVPKEQSLELSLFFGYELEWNGTIGVEGKCIYL